jgi:hypothetical protein
VPCPIAPFREIVAAFFELAQFTLRGVQLLKRVAIRR